MCRLRLEDPSSLAVEKKHTEAMLRLGGSGSSPGAHGYNSHGTEDDIAPTVHTSLSLNLKSSSSIQASHFFFHTPAVAISRGTSPPPDRTAEAAPEGLTDPPPLTERPPPLPVPLAPVARVVPLPQSVAPPTVPWVFPVLGARALVAAPTLSLFRPAAPPLFGTAVPGGADSAVPGEADS
uniref:Uncharacterized protein n=1 Tax=Chromera velia CCMP2878 TaxID=1169474 RepID=A0A0G4FYM6_9ALVE|eukprot:Cvel_19271.t1-p1 / transcript=Cvel_19271.t1 / gene=Cvel_19271 / organism=Chromera_velia_CCMP2878 / gene_product=hypothetical protein / transcript_product=hypothetical protein / location=Cvel_scaffold1650:6928-7464(-) / protein_length=179 / sequence_SO=supercontig / SO=protein_coding / is_pseudo=false